METDAPPSPPVGGFLTQYRPCAQCGTGVLVMYGEYAPLTCREHN